MIPSADGRNADFYRHAASGTLHLQQCAGCARHHHPPRYLCGECGSSDLAFVPSAGTGRIFSWTVTHRPVDTAWAREIPYATVVVAMDEGPRLVGGLRGLDPTDLELDLPVTAEIERVNDEFARVYFRPAPETRKTETRKTET
jgi:uncharacterized OB-fold protein